MYVAKITRAGIRCKTTLFEKNWSEEMSSYEIKEIKSKYFFMHSSGYRWINREMARIMFEQHRLEIVDG